MQMDFETKRAHIVEQFLMSKLNEGKIVTIVNIKNKKELNGKKGEIVGMNVEKVRCQVKIPGYVKPFLIRPKNLKSKTTAYQSSTVSVDEELIFELMTEVFEEKASYYESEGIGDRQDINQRLLKMVDMLQNRNLQIFECGDQVLPREKKNEFMKLLSDIQACCVGNFKVDFRKFGTGFMGVGNEECAICNDPVQRAHQIFLFPCGHQFHYECAFRWLSENSRYCCPTCGKQVSGNLQDYVVNFRERLKLRLAEWVISGHCERCQAEFIEQSELMAVPLPTGECLLVPKSDMHKYKRYI